MVHRVLAKKKVKKEENLFENSSCVQQISKSKRNVRDLDPAPIFSSADPGPGPGSASKCNGS